jgi:dienelactone hydrolase
MVTPLLLDWIDVTPAPRWPTAVARHPFSQWEKGRRAGVSSFHSAILNKTKLSGWRAVRLVFAVTLLCLPSLAFGQVEPLAGTTALTWEGDLSERMMDGAHSYVERKIGEAIQMRPKHWRRDVSSRQAYEASVEPNRERFMRIIGVVDPRLPARMERFGDDSNPALVSETQRYRIYQVRWPVLEGVTGEGLLLVPTSRSLASVVALPDADQTPEQLVGLMPGLPPEVQFARRLAENGFEVLVPALVDRDTRWSRHPDFGQTDQPHREWIYRQAFHMGRHIIGYEVQRILAAVDWFHQKSAGKTKIGVAGYGEGGLLAFYAAASDPRIDVALISGYFRSRQDVWSEPIYRNVWGLLREFGDAEVATLIAPRDLVVEYSAEPTVASPRGDLKTPPFKNVSEEFRRIDTLLPPGFQRRQLLSGSGHGLLPPGSSEGMKLFTKWLAGDSPLAHSSVQPIEGRKRADVADRQRRLVKELEGHVQQLVRNSEHVRDRFFLYKVAPELADRTWSKELRHKTLSPEPFVKASAEYRRYFWEEVLGRFDEPLLPPNPRTRKIYDTEKWAGYEVVLDVWKELFAWGILLVPKEVQPGERRPVVVCQHGRQGVPRQVVAGDDAYYRNFGARLAERGFVVFAPHNLYRGEDRYRWLSRKANGVKASLFSFIISQHDQLLRWLATLPFVDDKRIGFYGLSYGGETAMRVPTVLESYALSICSGDFNSWTRKVAATDQPFSFMFTIEWEMPYFNMGQTFDYAEMSYLMLPRPFMVERGHHDHVGRDQWVAHEYAKVRWLYTQFGLQDRTEIEYFNGGHTINSEGTFQFLSKHLNWPEKSLGSPAATAEGR